MPAFTPQDRESLRRYLLDRLTPAAGRWAGHVCDHTLRHTTNWLSMHDLDVEAYTAGFHEANIDCDCKTLIYTIRASERPPL